MRTPVRGFESGVAQTRQGWRWRRNNWLIQIIFQNHWFLRRTALPVSKAGVAQGQKDDACTVVPHSPPPISEKRAISL